MATHRLIIITDAKPEPNMVLTFIFLINRIGVLIPYIVLMCGGVLNARLVRDY